MERKDFLDRTEVKKVFGIVKSVLEELGFDYTIESIGLENLYDEKGKNYAKRLNVHFLPNKEIYENSDYKTWERLLFALEDAELLDSFDMVNVSVEES